MRMKPVVTNERRADDDYQVVTVEGGGNAYRKKPCKKCPWRKDAVGEFPAEAFRISAHTAYDMAMEKFGCHASGVNKPATCAGFLLRGARHNFKVRLEYMRGEMRDDVSDGGHELHANYREMALANGVDPGDPVLAPCRD